MILTILLTLWLTSGLLGAAILIIFRQLDDPEGTLAGTIFIISVIAGILSLVLAIKAMLDD